MIKSMKIAIIALGSQGDVQPYIALAKGLQAANHDVCVITHENFQPLIQEHGLSGRSVQGNVQEFIETPEMRALLEKGDFLAISAHTSKLMQTVVINWGQVSLAACREVDLIIAGVGGQYLAIALAEKLQIPWMPAYVFPLTPTRAFPGVLFPQSLGRLGGGFNHFSHVLMRQVMWQNFRKADRRVRSQVLQLPAAPFFGPDRQTSMPTLYGFSRSVIPQPSDWQKTELTGYWFLDAPTDWTPPLDLVEFLENGPPPLYIGFGSMGSRQPEATADLVLQALAQTQQRAILLSGWGGLQKADVPENVLMVQAIPHAWLFPRMAAIVHHGGAGTTAAGLRSGVPSIVIPFFGDQLFWGQRVAALGVGPAPIPRSQLTVARLAQAIQTAVTDRSMRQRAAELGAKIQAEDGVANAVAIVNAISDRPVV
jgi:sterol 3beta-glucosyltransferase